MNFVIRLDLPAIFVTGEAVDNVAVFGSLKMARAALDDGVSAAISETRINCENGIKILKAGTADHISYLKAARKAALKIREADLTSDGPAAQPTLPTLPTIGDQMREIGRQVEAGATGAGEKAA